MPAENDIGVGSVAAAKHAARVRARGARDCLDLEVCRAHAHSLCARLLEVGGLNAARVVLTYAALPSEIDPSLAIESLRARGVRIAYTRIEAPGVLGLHEVADETSLEPGPLSIRQPRSDEPRLDPREVDAVIVPGVAFDEAGARLGYGGGYFDRLLPTLRPDCLRIGVAFDEQILAEIPAEEHDERVDVVVTPSRTVHPPTAR